MLQMRLSEDAPEQLTPPYAGEGFVQVFLLVCVPDPQVFEQVDHGPYELQPPLILSRFQQCRYSLIYDYESILYTS